MNPHDLPTDIGKHLAGPAGSAIALIWLNGRLLRKCAMFFAGCILSWYVAGPASIWLDLPEGFTGLLLGIFGMAVVDKIFEVIRTVQPGELITDFIRKRLGLERKES